MFYLGIVVCLDESVSNFAGQHSVLWILLQSTLIHLQCCFWLWGRGGGREEGREGGREGEREGREGEREGGRE